MTNNDGSVRTLRDELVEELRTYEPRNETILTVYFNDETDDNWAVVPTVILDDYVPQGGDIDAVVYSTEYVYVLERAPESTKTVPDWTFRGVPRQKRLFSLKHLKSEAPQTQLTDLEAGED